MEGEDDFDNEGFDEAFADLISSLREAEAGNASINSADAVESTGPNGHGLKVESAYNGSPYDRFRRQRGMLSVFTHIT